MNSKLKYVLFRSIPLLLTVTLLAGCGLFTTEAEIPTTPEGYTALRDPFGEDLTRWSLARPFAARGGDSGGSWPADVYVTEDLQSADVYPIATGNVVKVGSVDSQASWRGQYVVIEHSGRFLLPASEGTHVNATTVDSLPTELAIGNTDPMLPVERLFTTDAKLRHDFSGEASYTLNEDTVSKVYSVYKNLTALNVRVGSSITDLSNPLGRLNVAPTQPAYRPALELEIRYFGNREVNDAAYKVVMGPSGDGSFADVTQMLGFGYLEASSVIQANLDATYYDGVEEQPDDSDESANVSSSELSTEETSAAESSTTTLPEESTEPEPTPEPDPQPGTAEEATKVRSYLVDINNYLWFSDIKPIPVFTDLNDINSVWLAERFLMDAVSELQIEQISLSQLESYIQVKINPAITLDPAADYGQIPLVEWNAGLGQLTILPSGVENWTNTNDIRLETLTRIGERFEAIVYELVYQPLYSDSTTRNFGLVASSGRYVGFYDHDNFNVNTGNVGLVERYSLSGDQGRLDQYQYTMEMDEAGDLHLVSKTLLPGSPDYRDSLPALSSIQVQQGRIVNTGGFKLRVRSGPSMNAEELGYINEEKPVYFIGPPSNGFLVIFDPAADHAPTGFASSQYIAVD